MTRVDTAIVSLAVLLLLALVPVVAPVGAGAATCTTTVSSVSAATAAVSSAAVGSTVCLADGNYGRLILTGSKAAPGVVVRAENPGGATIAGATLAGANLTVAHFRFTSDVTIATGSLRHDRRPQPARRPGTGSSYGVFVCPATPPDHCDDVTIRGNKFDGSFNEDAIRANVYHDGRRRRQRPAGRGQRVHRQRGVRRPQRRLPIGVGR